MTTAVNTPDGKATGWTTTQAYVMAVACLLIGIALGYLLHGSGSTPPQAAPTPSPHMGAPGAQQQVTPEQLKQMADAQAAPMLERLKQNPNDAALLAQLGNLYYDAQQFPVAVEYYSRSLTTQPANTDVRTDMATAYWFLGNADRAIAEFRTVLKTEPNKSNALFNLGVVQWQGKMDADGAVASWEKLLQTNPTYANKEQVQQLIAQAKKHAGVKPGAKTDKPAL